MRTSGSTSISWLKSPLTNQKNRIFAHMKELADTLKQIAAELPEQPTQKDIEDATAELRNMRTTIFYAPQNRYFEQITDDSKFDHFEDGTANFYQAAADPPQHVTMLVDVEGTVRATIGIVPCKEISIPPDQYAAALKNIEVTFKHAPLLTGRTKISLPLRPVHEHAWTWVERIQAETNASPWREIFPGGRIEQPVFEKHWKAAEEVIPADKVWAYLLRDEVKWLSPSPNGKEAIVVDKKDRKSPAFALFADNSITYDIRGKEATVEEIFDLYAVGVVPMSTAAVFTGSQEIREGWLKLRRTKNIEAIKNKS